MLNHLHIRDFAIVDSVELDLNGEMTAITGETGAGKSIMVDALGLLLGDRADSGVVRHGCQRAEIAAEFDIEHIPAAKAWLESRDLPVDEGCLLRRTVSREGRSRAYINGSPQPLQSVRELGELLVEIHGQHEHQSLLKRDAQRTLLDDFGASAEAAGKVNRAWSIVHDIRERLASHRLQESERAERIDLLRYQSGELNTFADDLPGIGALEKEATLLGNSGRLIEACQQCQGWISDEEGADTLLSRCMSELEPLASLDPRLASALELVTGAQIQAREAADELRNFADSSEIDPARLDWLQQRLADIQELARKHRIEPAELAALSESMGEELSRLEGEGRTEEELTADLEQAEKTFNLALTKLSAQRVKAAKSLSAKVSAAMQTLGLEGGRFDIHLEALAEPGAHGAERAEYQVSANPGQPLRALSKVASGGELSRISLAIQMITAQNTRIPTMVFDEVDTGIGGGIAEVVGRELRKLGDHRQVLCVTHLPQVAAQAHHHLQVSKNRDKSDTQTQIDVLGDKLRQSEIARMLGGVEITKKTLDHAREMIERAAEG